MMLAIDIFLKFWTLIGGNLSTKKDQNDFMILYSMRQKKNFFLASKKIVKILAVATLQYTIAFGLFQMIGFTFSTIFCGSSQCFELVPQSFQSSDYKNPRLDIAQSIPARMRVLEEKEEQGVQRVLKQEEISKLSSSDLDALSLAAGKILSSLNMDVDSFVISKNGQIAFVSIYYTGIIRILNISNYQRPSLISSFNITSIGGTFSKRSLILSNDEKTLFLSTFQILDIVDVSDITAPVYLGNVHDPAAIDHLYFQIPGNWFYHISMVLSEDERYLFVGGLALQVIDVTDRKSPILINSTLTRDPHNKAIGSSLSISLDKKTLFYANGTLNAFDITNPKEMRSLFSYSDGLEEITGVTLSRMDSRAYITGCTDPKTNRRSVLRVFDISEISNPRVIKSYDLNVSSKSTPRIVHLAPEDSHIFLVTDVSSVVTGLEVFNFLKEELLDSSRSMLPKVKALMLTSDSKNVIAAANNQFIFMKLNFIYPNRRAFSLTSKTATTFDVKGDVNTMILSSDEKILFINSGNPNQPDLDRVFEIYNVSEPFSPKLLSLSEIGCPSYGMDLSESAKRVIIFCEDAYVGLDISDLKEPKPLFPMRQERSRVITDFLLSKDGKTGYLVDQQFMEAVVEVFDFSNIEDVQSYYPDDFPKDSISSRILLSQKDPNIVFYAELNLKIFDMSDIHKPKVLSSIKTAEGEPDPRIIYAALSPNEKLLVLTTFESGGFCKMRLFDIEDLKNPRHVSETIIPKVKSAAYKLDPTFSPDGKTVYIVQENGLLIIDVSNPVQPVITGVRPIETKPEVSIWQTVFSKDMKVGYAATNTSEVQVLSFELHQTLFLNQEQFSLGNKYSDSVKLFNLNSNKRFLPFGKEEYRFTKTALFNIEVIFTETSAQTTLSSLPDWISFDKDNSMITIDPRSERDLGTYTIYSAFSKKIPLNAFDGLTFSEEGVTTEDLITTLIALGYLDTELFLTSSFISFQNFFLTSGFASVKKDVFEILKNYYIEVCTTFDVLPSLSIGYSKKIAIVSPSTNPIRVDFRFDHNREDVACGHFLAKTYASLQPIIIDKKSELVFEGSIKEVNLALQKVVANLENEGAHCGGSLIINDNLNPVITDYVGNLSSYFDQNNPPKMNSNEDLNVKNQVSKMPIFTGEYFSLTFNKKTFTDDNTESLTYHMTMKDQTKSFPTWLSFSDLDLKGTPPEEFLGRDIELRLVAKNEFKESEAVFTLHVKLSPVYILKLCLQFSPYLITFIGLLISTNKIYNVIWKGNYRYRKDHYLEVGKEITNEIILPILFVRDEKKESEIIFRWFWRSVSKGSINKYELARQFINNGEFEKERIIEAINKSVHSMSEKEKEKVPVYLWGPESHRQWINQFIINQLVRFSLKHKENQQTYKVYKKHKDEWLEFINWDLSWSQFVINQEKLDNFLRTKNQIESSLSSGLLGEFSGVNVSLLKDAIRAFAYKCQCIDLSAIDSQVLMKEKRTTNWVKTFLKLDLRKINYLNNIKVDYGIKCNFEDDCLIFSGNVQSNFKRKTVVIQIMNHHERIMKELWIYESSLCLKINEKGFGADQSGDTGNNSESYSIL